MCCNTRTTCNAAAAGSNYSAGHRRPIPNFIVPTRPARATSSICDCGTDKAIPDEDFAETFAVWMGQRAHWRKRYESWPALEKLEYVDALMAEIGMAKPELTGRSVVEPASRNDTTLANYYKVKQKRYITDPPTVYDRDLKRIFSDDPRHRRAPLATIVPAPPRRPHPRHRGKVDRTVPVEHRRRAGRHDDPLPRSRLAGGRTGTAIGDRFHRTTHIQDREIPLHPHEAAMVRAVKKAKRPLKVLVLLHPELMPPDSTKGYSEKEIHVWKTEYDVVSTLRSRGHDVRALGLKDELKPIRDAIEGDWKPDVVFNLLEEFHGDVMYDQNVVSYLELLRLPYTGCNPRGLMLARGKALSKKLAAYHRIPVPDFTVFSIGRAIKRPPRLAYPLIVKSLSQDASLGIAQASLVDNDEKLAERVTFIHEKIGTDAIAEQYIDGREIYVGVLGSERLRVLPVWELEFGDLNASSNRIATTAVKHDLDYQERHHDHARSCRRTDAGTHDAHPASDQTHLPRIGTRRLCPHRFPPFHRQRALFHRGQSQSGDCPGRGIRPGRAAYRHPVSGPSGAHALARHSPGAGEDRRVSASR